VAAVPARMPLIWGQPAAVVLLLGPQELFQLAVVEEDAPAVLALLQAHPLLVDGMQGPLAFRTCHPCSIRSIVSARTARRLARISVASPEMGR
jgi:hypothetical protein